MENNGKNRMSLQESQQIHKNLVNKMDRVVERLLQNRIDLNKKLLMAKSVTQKNNLSIQLEKLDAEIASKQNYIRAFLQRIATEKDCVK